MTTSGNPDPNIPKSPKTWLLIAVCCSVVLIQVVYGLLVFAFIGQMDVRGQFGDIFGGVNALFTGLAFAGVIYTILLQRRELELQREELRLNRAELSRSAQAQSDQVAVLKQSADLSATTTLVNVYGALLQPFWEGTQGLRMDLGHLRGQAPKTEEDLRNIKAIRSQLRDMETEWKPTLKKHEDLVVRLEELVKQAAE